MGEPNRLIHEASPYLRQHAHNPVDWYPWGDEAFAKAKAADKPVLLSIGYSACHWCHVMEHESFDNKEIAALQNELFVSIKVDREERPDVDHLYQLVVQLQGKGGGWPLTVFLTPDRKPFFAGTYFPPADRFGLPGFPTILNAVADAYRVRRADLEAAASEIVHALGTLMKPTESRGTSSTLTPSVAVDAAAKMLKRMDPHHGGFGTAPKFPNSMNLDVLLRAYVRTGTNDFLDAACRALDGMANGGIFDQLGGGFHRYSVDAQWLIPHFEKMLYDNALLARTYLDAWRITGRPRYEEVCRSTLEYMLREMMAPGGGFCASQDADSEGVEGKFFAWTPSDFQEMLTEKETEFALGQFGVTDEGNFEHGTSVLRRMGDPEDAALFENVRRKLFDAREKRVKPFRDEKVIAAWNGLAIGVFAEAGVAFSEPRFLDAARSTLAFLRARLWNAGVLHRTLLGDRVGGRGVLEDYASVACAALSVHEATGDADALHFARELIAECSTRFWSESAGTFYDVEAESSDLIVRVRDTFDNATPAGATLVCEAMMRATALEANVADTASNAIPTRYLATAADEAARNPMGFGYLLHVMDGLVHGPVEIYVSPDKYAERRVAYSTYSPFRVVKNGIPAGASTPGVYVCRNRTCSAPIESETELARVLGQSPLKP